MAVAQQRGCGVVSVAAAAVKAGVRRGWGGGGGGEGLVRGGGGGGFVDVDHGVEGGRHT